MELFIQIALSYIVIIKEKLIKIAVHQFLKCSLFKLTLSLLITSTTVFIILVRITHKVI